MKRDVKQSAMKADNLKTMRAKLTSGGSLMEYSGLLALLADIADECASGADCWCTFGASRDRTGLLLTVHLGTHRLYAGGGDLGALSSEAELLL